MTADKVSPQIAHLSWGKLELADGRRFKDAKLFPGGGREWDWRETGTRHLPGIQIADIEELLQHGATVIILSKGINERLHVTNAALAWLRRLDIPTHVLQTEEAVKRYNALAATELVGGLFHTTC